jgi:hypothetical protein
MNNPSPSVQKSRLPFGLSLRSSAVLAIVILVAVRAASEFSMMQEHGPDAQMGIWNMELLIKATLWSFAGFVPLWVMSLGRRYRWVAYGGVLELLVWGFAICNASWKYHAGRQALADAANRTTSAERLSDLVHFDGIQAGYELDNRLASNLNTPAASLRELSLRDQVGTRMLLTRNPNTPHDLLQRLRDGRP